MDEACIYLRRSVSRPPLDADPDVVVLDGYWGQYMTREHKALTAAKDGTYLPPASLTRYCEGRAPEPYAKKWTPAGRIFVPFNVGGKHWVALEIILSEWTVYVYDPDVNLYSIQKLKKALLPVLQLLPRVVLGCSHLAPLHSLACNVLKMLRVKMSTRNQRA